MREDTTRSARAMRAKTSMSAPERRTSDTIFRHSPLFTSVLPPMLFV